MIYAKIGSVFYILWGLLHLVAAKKVYILGQTLESGMVQGRIFQDAFYLLFFAIFGIVVAVIFNWKNSKLGFWLNSIVISFIDIGFIITILIPGYLPLFPGLIGPILWLLALVFTAVGLYQRNN